MPTPDDLTPDAFARLSALEQSQELLRRAQFLADSSQRRQVQAIDRYADDLLRHEGMLLRQQHLQAQAQALADRLTDRQDSQAARQQDHAARMARLEDIAGRIQLTLDAVLAMLRDRNG
jgi:hypothetical protein